MAVTFPQRPTDGSIVASDTPILYSFASNQANQANFSFVVQTFIDGILISTDMVFPERGSSAHFDASRIALVYVKALPRYVSLMAAETLHTLQVKVAERFGVVPITQAFTASTTCKLVKASCSNQQFQFEWLTTKYTPSLKWLSDSPDSTVLVSRKYPIYASILNTDPDATVGLLFYDFAGDIVHVYTSTTIIADKVNVCLKPAELEIILLGSGYTLAQISKITIEMNVSDQFVVQYVDDDCSEFHQMNWLNNLGSYDQFLFTHNRDSDSAVTSQEYKKQFGAWTGNVFVYDDLNTGNTDYVREIQETGTLYSGWISQQYQNWLTQIVESVDHQLLEPGTSEKIIVTDTKTSKLKHRFEEALNYQVNFKKTNFKSITQ